MDDDRQGGRWPATQIRARFQLGAFDWGLSRFRRPICCHTRPFISDNKHGSLARQASREWLFGAAVRCLYNCSWEAERGFNSISSPRRIANNAPLLRRLAAGVGDGSVINALGNHSKPSIKDAFKLAMSLMRGTDFYKVNTWRFVNGNLDQGLLFYLMYLHYGVGTWSSPFPREPESVYVNHYWGRGKPWERPGRTAQQVLCQRARLDACAPQCPRVPIDRRSLHSVTWSSSMA